MINFRLFRTINLSLNRTGEKTAFLNFVLDKVRIYKFALICQKNIQTKQ